MEFAGFEGENKMEMYAQLPQKYYPKTLCVAADESFENLTEKIAAVEFEYPFIVKPQVGMHAMMFRKIHNPQQLCKYHHFTDIDYMVQQWIDLPMEFSVFHIRYPGEKKGQVTGFILKDYLAVTGDGVSSLLQLIRRHPKARRREEEMKQKHAPCLKAVIPKGENIT
jgi:hypothetical protein